MRLGRIVAPLLLPSLATSCAPVPRSKLPQPVHIESSEDDRQVRVEIERPEDDRIVTSCERTPCDARLPSGPYVVRVLPDYGVADRERRVRVPYQGAIFVVHPGRPIVRDVGLFVGVLGTLAFVGGMAILLRPRMCDGPGDDCAREDRIGGILALSGAFVGATGWILHGVERTAIEEVPTGRVAGLPNGALLTF